MSNVLTLTGISDSLGMPFEGRPTNDPYLLSWDGKSFYKGHYGKGGVTDDTQMSICVAESLLANGGFNPYDLAKRYVEWYTSGAARGMGRTTFAAIQCLIKGVSPFESGIEKSYGNGTAMRAAPFGVFFKNDLETLIQSVKMDSAITHQSVEAEAGALAIALTVYFILNLSANEEIVSLILPHLPESKTKERIKFVAEALDVQYDEIPPSGILAYMGTSFKVFETVPAALYTFLKFPKFTEGVSTLIKAGGDTDTTAAIFGALYGAKYGLFGIPKYLHKVENFDYLTNLDKRLSSR